MSRKFVAPVISEGMRQIADLIDREVREQLSADATFEQRQDAAAGCMSGAMWLNTDRWLKAAVTTAEHIEIEGRTYRRLEQRSSATYRGRFGSHHVEEPLYRDVDVRNGPTVKPVELRVGIIEHMTPEMARIIGQLGAEGSSREVEKTLRVVGLVPPSRAFIAKRTTQMAAEIAEEIPTMEQAAREAEPALPEVASMSCGLDRMSVRMSEPASDEEAKEKPRRTEPYERTPPPAQEHHYRKAWVGSVTCYDKAGDELHTLRYATEADAEPKALAERVSADVATILRAHPEAPVHCVQDAASELRALPEALARTLPANANVRVLVDFEHLMGYLDAVVDTTEAKDDPHNWKDWYRGQLLRDDQAIERIWRKLRRLAEKLDGHDTPARKAVASALSYIRTRKNKMRYASYYVANLPIGSGATESTCWQMQQRVKLPGQSWKTVGLRGVLAMRGLALSDRWTTAWQPYAARHRKEVRVAA